MNNPAQQEIIIFTNRSKTNTVVCPQKKNTVRVRSDAQHKPLWNCKSKLQMRLPSATHEGTTMKKQKITTVDGDVHGMWHKCKG